MQLFPNFRKKNMAQIAIDDIEIAQLHMYYQKKK